MGLAVAYQVQRSYAQEHRVRKFGECRASRHRSTRKSTPKLHLARSARPRRQQLRSESTLASPLRLGNVSAKSAGSPRRIEKPGLATRLHRRRTCMKAAISEMNMVAESEPACGRSLEAKRRGTRSRQIHVRGSRRGKGAYDPRQHQPGNIGRERQNVLAKDRVEARRARLLLAPLSLLGILLVVPAFFYARRLDRNIRAYETQLESERSLLEEKELARERTSLRNEIEYRERMESRSTRAATGCWKKSPKGKSSRKSSLSAGAYDGALCPWEQNASSSSREKATVWRLRRPFHLRRPHTLRQRCYGTGTKFPQRKPRKKARYSSGGSIRIRGAGFANVWTQGFHAIIAVPITEQQQQQPMGVIALVFGRHAGA